jgi:hypothetical protein
MQTVTALVVVAMLGADLRPVDRPARPAVQAAAFVGAGFLTAGVAFEIAASDRTLAQYAVSNTIGGIALMAAGLCFITIAAVLTTWHFPSLSVWATAGGAGLVVSAPWP